MSIPLNVIDDLSAHPNIVGIKDSERNEERLNTSLRLWAHRKDFSYFLGWSARSAASLINGGDGIVPSTGNFNPGVYHDLYQAALEDEHEKAFAMQELSDLSGSLYQAGRLLRESLSALKIIMKRCGLCETHVMPPLSLLPAAEQAKVLQETEIMIEKYPGYFKTT